MNIIKDCSKAFHGYSSKWWAVYFVYPLFCTIFRFRNYKIKGTYYAFRIVNSKMVQNKGNTMPSKFPNFVMCPLFFAIYGIWNYKIRGPTVVAKFWKCTLKQILFWTRNINNWFSTKNHFTFSEIKFHQNSLLKFLFDFHAGGVRWRIVSMKTIWILFVIF